MECLIWPGDRIHSTDMECSTEGHFIFLYFSMIWVSGLVGQNILTSPFPEKLLQVVTVQLGSAEDKSAIQLVLLYRLHHIFPFEHLYGFRVRLCNHRKSTLKFSAKFALKLEISHSPTLWNFHGGYHVIKIPSFRKLHTVHRKAFHTVTCLPLSW